jgi:positive regulator of sigma E activity
MSNGRTYTLRNAASIVFALTAVIPLLLFTYTLYLLGQLGQSQAQMGLGVALGCALGYLDLRFADFDWRAQHPKLKRQAGKLFKRPPLEATEPRDPPVA